MDSFTIVMDLQNFWKVALYNRSLKRRTSLKARKKNKKIRKMKKKKRMLLQMKLKMLVKNLKKPKRWPQKRQLV